MKRLLTLVIALNFLVPTISDLPAYRTFFSQLTVAAEESGEAPDPEEEPPVPEEPQQPEVYSGTFQISGAIVFDEILDDQDWSTLVRPREFNQPILLKQTYVNNAGETCTEIYETQDSFSQQAFYLKFYHDGEGGGDFLIENVPKTVVDGGVEYQVQKYEVYVAPLLPYYVQNDPIAVEIENPQELSQASGTLKLELLSQVLTLNPVLVPEDTIAPLGFALDLTCTNPQTEEITAPDGLLGFSFQVAEPTEVRIPVGLHFSVTQQPAAGFKFDNTYTILTADGEEAMSDCAEGTIELEQDVTVSTVNYAQNLSVGFDIEWIDNNNITRPAITEDSFSLQYQAADGTWITVDADSIAALDLDDVPELHASTLEADRYYFTGLPAVAKDGTPVKYQVVPNVVPEDYVCSYEDREGSKQRTFLLEQQTTMHAEIYWNDDSDADGLRPDHIEGLRFYRRTETSCEELELPEDAIQKAGNRWTVDLSDLPRYDRENREYDYVLVQGKIVDGKPIPTAMPNYRAYYDNGTAAYGNDITLCHNNGKITEVLVSKAEFSAHKVWLDAPEDKATRPAATVTLWRYIETEDISSLDAAFENGVVTQVIYQTEKDGASVDQILSYALDDQKDTATVEFTAQTVDGLSQTYTLPGNDDHGHKYVYFVRESLSGEHEDNYEVVYLGSDGETRFRNGTRNDGIIQNVRREKAAISVSKLWKNPNGLADIDESAAELQVWAKPVGSADDAAYEQLVVYSEEEKSYEVLSGANAAQAQTADGFTDAIPYSEVTYYVNIYNSEGRLYDMEHAVIREIVHKDGESYASFENTADGITELDYLGQTYKVTCNFDELVLLGDGMKQFRYNVTNTIFAYRDYLLEKEWDSSIQPEEYADITRIEFLLERCSVRDLMDDTVPFETVGTYTIDREGNSGRHWDTLLKQETEKLPKYNDDGYEYYYRAIERKFYREDGTAFTVAQANTLYQWQVLYHRTPEKTRAVNYRGTEGYGFFTVSKLWQDNNDTEARLPVTVRVYERSHLIEALQQQMAADNRKPDELADLSKLSGYGEYVLNPANDYTRDVGIADIMAKTHPQDTNCTKKTGWTDYITLEYLVGSQRKDGAIPASYTYQELLEAAGKPIGYTYQGTAEHASRQYTVDASAAAKNSGHVILINTRSGNTKIQVRKAWKDQNNASGNRPAQIRFQLYQDGTAYKNLPETVTTDNPNARILHTSGQIVLSGSDESQWSFTLDHLPMFSDSGEPHFYHVDEVKTVVDATAAVQYSKKLVSTAMTGDEKKQSYTFQYENTIFGYTSHIAYKYWYDVSVDPGNRPDLYFKLYQYKTDDAKAHPDTDLIKLESCIPFNEGSDQIWTIPEENDPDSDFEHGYHWKILVDTLPAFDENGIEYGYFFTESMNNDGKTVQGTYVQTCEFKKHQTEVSKNTTYEVFTNTITDYMTVGGSKTWTGLKKSYYTNYANQKEELPDPVISLYRTTDETIRNLQSLTNAQLNDLGDRITLVDRTTLNVAKNTYQFPDADARVQKGVMELFDGKLMLPKFDADGRRYTYLVRETLDEAVVDQLYQKINANGTLSNIFRNDLNRRSITVNKSWLGRDWTRQEITKNEDCYPSITFRLYRYLLGKEETTTVLLEERQLSAESIAETEGKISCTFSDLLIYAPNGKQYGYYIEEKAVDGYSIAYQNADGTKNARRIDVTDLPDTWNVAGADNNTQVGIQNSYDQKGKIRLSGAKQWDDYENYEGLRPEEIEVKLYRRTLNEKNQNNAVAEEEVTPLPRRTAEDPSITTPYIVWQKGTDPKTSPKWSYVIYNLERYAPNGMPYIYTLSESQPKGYEKPASVTITADKTSTTLNFEDDLVNKFEGAYYVRKNWSDGYNKYNLRPDSVTIKLQRSRDGGATYEDMRWTDAMEGKLPSVLTNDNQEPIVSVTLTKENVVPNTRQSAWDYWFRNLPVLDKSGKPYQYRCVEVAIGGANIETDENGKQTAGSYACSYRIQNDTKTLVDNTLDSTSLVVTKDWIGDQEDLYGSRPEELRFYLQKKGFLIANSTESEEMEPPAEDEWTDWITVTDEDDKPILFTLRRKDNWSSTLEDLPIAEIVLGADGKSYTLYTLNFRAVECTADGSIGGTVRSAQNYQDTTDYTAETFVVDHNESHLENTLILDDPAKTVTVTKRWQRVPGKQETAVLELLFRTVGETDWHCYGNPGKTVTDSHKPQDGCLTQSSVSTEAGSEIFTWTDLPKYDRAGRLLEYQVIEHPVAGYATKIIRNGLDYIFINTELQSYTVEKHWHNTSYAHKDPNGSFTAEFELQQKIGDGDWQTIPDSTIQLTSQNAADTSQFYTWKDLPKYADDAAHLNAPITYRAVETKINGNPVQQDSDGNYIVTYTYDDNRITPEFCGTKTVAENRMIYGFVNLSKTAAFLSPDITPDGSVSMQDVTFDLYYGTGSSKELYAAGISVDENGNLILNDDKTYGTTLRKRLITGTYTLVEAATGSDYSLWKNGVVFTVGNTGGDTDTGEHGTAWIHTVKQPDGSSYMLQVTYLPSNKSHQYSDACTQTHLDGDAYNMESRGVIRLKKTGVQGAELDTHAGADGDRPAYFGVYLDQACKKQVAGMMATGADQSEFLLVNTNADGKVLQEKNAADIPYLRPYGSGFSLLSGTYYLQEKIPPAGYRLDSTVRKAVIPKIETTDENTDLSSLYKNNVAAIQGSIAYQWENIPNQVKLYKMDQFGRKITLNPDTFLKLSVSDGTFATGTDTIRLYQSSSQPASLSQGITYDEQDGSWTITGLFDSSRTYTLSEPPEAVPEENVIAEPLVFTVDEAGELQVSEGAVERSNPLTADGSNYGSCYQADATENVVVLRDIARVLVDAGIRKRDFTDQEQGIPNISFTLYKYEELDENQQPVHPVSVLAPGVVLTTNAEGNIILSEQDPKIRNQITKAALLYGLDLGHYYFQELERGASDSYRLSGNLYFDIVANDEAANSPQDYARAEFHTSDHVVQAAGEYRIGTVYNDPVTSQKKELHLIKTDTDPAENKLSGAKFRLQYTSITNQQTGSANTKQYDCITDETGVLYLMDAQQHITSQKPDISKKGTYTLQELLAPEQYMTITENGSKTIPVTLTFSVDSENRIQKVQKNISQGQLLSYEIRQENGEDTVLAVTVQNRKTVVSLTKRNDLENGTKTRNQTALSGELLPGAVLQIFEGTAESGTLVATLDSHNYIDNQWTLTGILKENTIYTLHESSAPVGYLLADDLRFQLFGTVKLDGTYVSQLYVQDGTGWSKSKNLNRNLLTMVDEAIIAPVDVQKVVGADGTYTTLPDTHFTISAGDTPLGTAVTTASGWLVWESVEATALAQGIVYTAAGKRADRAVEVIGKTIILQQNAAGYTFTETEAPMHAYNDSGSYTVRITPENYREYKSGSPYKTDAYINLYAASQSETQTVAKLSLRTDAKAEKLVNPPYRSTVTLHKYDADEEGGRAAIPDTEFTLYRDGTAYTKATSNGVNSTSGVFKTDAKGDLSITIPEKGTYTLRETKAATGYQLDRSQAPSFTFTLQDEATAQDIAKRIFGYDQTNALRIDEYGIPNQRLTGTVSLQKKDRVTGTLLDGVVYTLTRNDKPEGLDEYLLQQPVEVVVGKSYTVSGHTIKEAETGAVSGSIVITGLNWGSYTLTEKTELPGYVFKQDAPPSVTFEIQRNARSVTRNHTNDKNRVILEKTNQLDPLAGILNLSQIKSLEGAVFEVHAGAACTDGCEAVPFYTSEQATNTSTQVRSSGIRGAVKIYGLPTDPSSEEPVTYHLAEITAPKGYKLQTEPVVFRIDREGRVQVQQPDGSFADTSQWVTMQDEAIKIFLQKLGEDNDPLSGAEFRLTDACETPHVLANGDASQDLSMDAEDGRLMIPIERVIGGHRYRLTETKAPDGYECTAEVTFTVNTDGTISDLIATGGYRGRTGEEACADTDAASDPTISIRNEKIRAQLVKVDAADAATTLPGVVYTLQPYGNSAFAPIDNTDLTVTGNTYTFVTDATGSITFPEGLLRHDNEYLLQETQTIEGYYLSQEAKAGVILQVAKDGTLTVRRLPAYQNHVIQGESSCPVLADGEQLTAKNVQSTSFALTKLVEGNMGDRSAFYDIQLTASEPDGTLIGTRSIRLRLGEQYDSREDLTNAFGTLPVGAIIQIDEDKDQDYTAVLRTVEGSGAYTVLAQEKGTVQFTLDTNKKVQIELVNTKNVLLDVGVLLEETAAWAWLAILIPAAWIFLRYRRQQKREEERL